jgi:hypothetical protein
MNFFATGLRRDVGLGLGALQLAWRLNYDPVGNTLKPSKPYVVNSKRIALTKGKPVKVAWL